MPASLQVRSLLVASTNAVPQCQDQVKLDQNLAAQHSRGHLSPINSFSYSFEQNHNRHQRKHQHSLGSDPPPMKTRQHLGLPRWLLCRVIWVVHKNMWQLDTVLNYRSVQPANHDVWGWRKEKGDPSADTSFPLHREWNIMNWTCEMDKHVADVVSIWLSLFNWK